MRERCGGHSSEQKELGFEVRGSLHTVATLPWEGVWLETGVGYPVKNFDLIMKPFPPPLKGEIPQDHFQSKASKDSNRLCCLPALPLTSCVTFGMLLTFPEPQFFHLENEYINTKLLLRAKLNCA